MSYNISSEKIDHPLLKPILIDLQTHFDKADISFFVIGALARDILMKLHNESSGRLTQDLDIAIAVNHWDEWLVLKDQLEAHPNFKKDPKNEQRFIYQGVYPVDIIPFGKIADQHHKIYWPPEEEIALSVLGYEAVAASVIEVELDNDLKVKLPSLVGIFVLKLVAWSDRNKLTNKDADDIGFILQNYLGLNKERAAVNFFEKVYADGETVFTGGALLLGIDLNEFLDEFHSVKVNIRAIIVKELEMEEESILIQQITESHKGIKYEEALSALTNIVNELS